MVCKWGGGDEKYDGNCAIFGGIYFYVDSYFEVDGEREVKYIREDHN